MVKTAPTSPSTAARASGEAGSADQRSGVAFGDNVDKVEHPKKPSYGERIATWFANLGALFSLIKFMGSKSTYKTNCDNESVKGKGKGELKKFKTIPKERKESRPSVLDQFPPEIKDYLLLSPIPAPRTEELDLTLDKTQESLRSMTQEEAQNIVQGLLNEHRAMYQGKVDSAQWDLDSVHDTIADHKKQIERNKEKINDAIDQDSYQGDREVKHLKGAIKNLEASIKRMESEIPKKEEKLRCVQQSLRRFDQLLESPKSDGYRQYLQQQLEDLQGECNQNIKEFRDSDHQRRELFSDANKKRLRVAEGREHPVMGIPESVSLEKHAEQCKKRGDDLLETISSELKTSRAFSMAIDQLSAKS